MLEDIDPVIFYGVGNGHLQMIRSLYPKLRIVARDNVIRVLGDEEQNIIQPVVTNCFKHGIRCFGPYAADGFFGSGNYRLFDAILAMYHDQGLAPFKALAMDDGVNYTAGLPIVRTSPAHGTAYDIAGKNEADESSFRQAVYAAIDVFRHRIEFDKAHAHPLRKQYYEKRDDSDKLKLDQVTDEDTL